MAKIRPISAGAANLISTCPRAIDFGPIPITLRGISEDRGRESFRVLGLKGVNNTRHAKIILGEKKKIRSPQVSWGSLYQEILQIYPLACVGRCPSCSQWFLQSSSPHKDQARLVAYCNPNTTTTGYEEHQQVMEYGKHQIVSGLRPVGSKLEN